MLKDGGCRDDWPVTCRKWGKLTTQVMAWAETHHVEVGTIIEGLSKNCHHKDIDEKGHEERYC